LCLAVEIRKRVVDAEVEARTKGHLYLPDLYQVVMA
jgi:hypothetical protein